MYELWTMKLLALVGGWVSLVSTLRQSHCSHTYDEPREEWFSIVSTGQPRTGMVNASFQRRF